MHWLPFAGPLLVVVVATTLVAGSPKAKPHNFVWDSIKHVYAFGDSYTFVEGELGRVNYSFIGDAFRYSFTPEELLSNKIITNKTSSEGANWLEFLTGCYGGLPSDCDVELWNFAFAGANISPDLLPLHHNYTVDLDGQVKQWLTYASDVIPHPPKETLTVWWIGINDTGDTINNSTITDWTAFWESEMGAYFEAVQSTVDHGLKQHLFMNVPPGDRSPNSNTNATRVEIHKQRVSEFNTALGHAIKKFAGRNTDATVLSFDAHSWFADILDHPAKHGFSNVTGYCKCAEPTGYVWYDAGHPTAQVHELLARAVDKHLERATPVC